VIERITKFDRSVSEGIISINKTIGSNPFLRKNIYDVNNNGIVDNVDAVTIEIVANEVILPYQIITLDGRVANSTNVMHTYKVAGIALEAANIGFICKTQIFGLLVNPLWSWSGYNLFLNGTSISEIFPTVGFNKHLGIVKNSNTMFVDLKNSILL